MLPALDSLVSLADARDAIVLRESDASDAEVLFFLIFVRTTFIDFSACYSFISAAADRHSCIRRHAGCTASTSRDTPHVCRLEGAPGHVAVHRAARARCGGLSQGLASFVSSLSFFFVSFLCHKLWARGAFVFEFASLLLFAAFFLLFAFVSSFFVSS